MRFGPWLLFALTASLALGCSSSGSSVSSGAGGSSGAATGVTTASAAESASSAASSMVSSSVNAAAQSSASASSAASATASSGSGGGAPTVAQLLALTASCDQISNGLYATDEGEPGTIPICALNGAVFWQSDMDIDCDGKETATCNSNTDPDFDDETAATDSNGDPLDSAALPYVVVPGPSTRWSYLTSGLSMGSVVAVIYDNQLVYAVIGDTGPSGIIGEGSVATANALGIDPSPTTGGADSGVTFIAFTGMSAIAQPIEDHAAAISIGEQLSAELVQNN